MRRRGDRLIYSPSDLIRYMESPYASFMQRLHLEFPDRVTPDEEDPQLRLIAEKGIQHEATYLAELESSGRDVARIEDTPDAADVTRAALTVGREVIFQAVLELDPFRGFADFLIRTDEPAPNGGFLYEVWDTKLANKPKPYYLIQLCAYAEMLEALQGVRALRVGVVLGNGDMPDFRTADFFWFYKRVKQAFLQQMAEFDPENPPTPDPRADHGVWQGAADAYLESVDHLVRVAGISRGQIEKFEAAGIDTLTALAETAVERVPKLAPTIFARLAEQARLQITSAGKDRPEWRVLVPTEDDPRRGLALLPPPSPMDVYFDMEGYPLVEGGLEYLFGAVTAAGGEHTFHDFWGFDAATEKQAFEGFVDWVMERWRADPTMHVYHYAPYEPNALKRLMGMYGTREDEIDYLLRHDVLVDLLRVVRQGVRIGTPGYSLKDIEHLYMEREGKVESAGQSIVYFAAWLASNGARDWRDSEILKDIRDYNEDDCVSTWKLVGWLRERQGEHAIEWIPTHVEPEEDANLGDPDSVRAVRRRLVERLLADLPDDPTDDGPDQAIQRLLAHLVEFHLREDKPLWWNFFEHHEMTSEQLVDDYASIGALVRDGEPEPIKQSLGFWYRFDPDQDTKVTEGDRVCIAGQLDVSFEVTALDADEGRVQLKIGKRALTKVEGGMPERASVFLHTRIVPEPIATSIQHQAERFEAERTVAPSLRNLLLHEPPPIVDHEGGSLLRAGEDLLVGTIRVIRSLCGGTLSIQGPPGSGKTFTGSHAIIALLDDGKNVGVVSNSHKAIINVLDACRERRDERDEALTCLKVGGTDDEPFFAACPGARWVQSSTDGAAAYGGGLVGGTAWFFARDDMRGQLDYLFVDEAGQVSMANLVGMAPSAANIVLLGDQMQLGQPTQGSHPGDSGLSALDFALGDRVTVPDHLGIFLGTTWRLHPGICSFISGAIYEDRLHPEDHTVNRVVQVPGDPGPVSIDAGIVFRGVEHDGNTQASEEEVAEVRRLVDALIGRACTDRNSAVTGAITIGDILIVAPYNMQVRRLRDALPSGARVASVDKFQGQEAPIVIVSLATSYGERSPRGLEFVLDKNRLNVAISRAKSLAIVVGDPRLALTPISGIPSMRRQNLLCRLIEAGTPTRDT